MVTRLTFEREAEIRAAERLGSPAMHAYMRDLLAELDALRAERDEARAALDAKLREAIPMLRLDPLTSQLVADAEARGEQRGRTAERADVVAWLRGMSRIDAHPAKVECADAITGGIERGEHRKEAP